MLLFGAASLFFYWLEIGLMRLIALVGFQAMTDPTRPNQAENDDGECCGETTGESSCFFEAIEHKSNGDQNPEDPCERSAERPEQVTD